ncbi:MAG: HDIG domain-containing protein [Marinifilaceae bacterium]|jgi:putative nucleotidyltransferase with HDIG domain|nr:HDIG domain-containing protein [Marinifilaceae bacterium]
MKKYYRWIRKNIKLINAYVFFLLATVFIGLMFPNIGNFKYEYQKGKPWMHETLIAPFDFSILKPEKDFLAEMDSVMNNFSPYFNQDTLVAANQQNKLIEDFKKAWLNHYGATKLKTDSLLLNSLLSYFNSIYSRGILESVYSNSDYDLKKLNSINIIKRNISTRVNIKDVLTPRKSYEIINNWIRLNPDFEGFESFMQDLDISDYLKTNLDYDKKMSDRVKKNLISNISRTQGMVEAGTRIVLVGDIVDDNIFLVLESLKARYENILGTSRSIYLVRSGQGFLILTAMIILFIFLFNFRKNIIYNTKKLLFILMLIVLFVGLTTVFIKFQNLSVYIIPYALIPIVIRILVDSRTALFVHIASIMICGFLAPNSFEFIFLQLSAGIIAIYSLPRLERRGQLVVTAVITFFIYSFVYFAFAITQEGNIEDIKIYNFAWFALNGLLLTFSYSLIYIFEKLFGFLSDVTLIELSNQNHPLLKDLSRLSPGTFQHSLQVANLAEAAINVIGGNPLLVRAGALYHDIGKMKNPFFFIENQVAGKNPHDSLDFDRSAQIITDHVKYGVQIAKKAKIPQQIIDFIETHHGHGRVQYFYQSFKNKYPDREIDEDLFTYPGNDPFTKETAVLMMADSIEAASRSLKSKTPENIRQLIENIIDGKVKDGRFENADISFKNISQIKEIFSQSLINIYHGRIEYPKEN